MNIIKYIASLVIILSIFSIGFTQSKSIKTIKGKKICITDLNNFVVENMDSLHIPGLSLSIINNGKIVHFKNYGVKNLQTKEEVDEETIFELCSISKPVFAYFVLSLAQKNFLNLDHPLYLYYTDQKIDTTNGYFKEVTARMVLNHCSGFPNWRQDEDMDNNLFFFSKPGTQYGYSGEGYQYLARVVAKILRKTDPELNTYFQNEVVKPLKLKSMNFTWNESLRPKKAFSHRKGIPTDNGSQGPPDWFGSAGSLHCNAQDFTKFLIHVMNKKNRISKQLISLNTSLSKEPDGLPRSFGFPYKLTEGKKRYYHTGNNGDARAYVHFYPNEMFGLTAISNCDNLFSSKFIHKLLAFLDEEMTY